MESTQQPTTTPMPSEVSRPHENKYGKLALKCVKCTATDNADGYILTLKHESTKELKTAFGNKVQPIKHTFYMKVAEPCEVGYEAVQDMSNFNIVEREFTFADTTTAEQVSIWCKWLHLK